ncbi:uncharacterized protein LOC142972486 [Anticarsia gemmatalis]|uniref:uncharacterized protein LOC142972486 n=1 Tax=Anticarsia gemmatalis TaxID=129554 RepID=UPI003F75F928
MAIWTIIFTVMMAAVASAGFGWSDEDQFGFDSPVFNFDPPKLKPLRPFKRNKFPTFEPFTMKPLDFDSFTMKPIPTMDPDSLAKYKPGKNEQFKGSYVSSHSFSSNVNGVKKSGGSLTHLTNDNGEVKKEKIVFNDPSE